MATKSPKHYTRGSIEVWDFIRDQDLNYHLGNAIKYICRAGYKRPSTKAEDLKKAIHYLENELSHTVSPFPTLRRPSDQLPDLVWNPELSGEPDYATGFDR
tara:strand:+ start:4830 stop:5132 length:303 start_codon:yes stop_codon:yes gene_type:complete